MIHNLNLAEREGFEPPVPLSTTVFKTAAIDHSAISPRLPLEVLLFKSDAKVRLFFESASILPIFLKKILFRMQKYIHNTPKIGRLFLPLHLINNK